MSDALPCPRCGARLYLSSTTSISMRGCGACGGVFLDNAAAARLMSLVPEDALQLAEGADAHAPRRLDTAAPVSCPICGRPMNRVHVKAAGVDVDTCGAHGTFYDRKELVTVARACKRARVATPVIAGAAAAAGVAGIAAIAAAHAEQPPERNLGPDAVDTAMDVAEVAADAASEVDVGGVVEVAGDIIGGLFELLGALAD